MSPSVAPTFTVRISTVKTMLVAGEFVLGIPTLAVFVCTVPCALTTYTNVVRAVALNGRGGNQRLVVQRVNQQFRVDKLVGEKSKLSSLVKMALSRMVPVPLSIWLSRASTLPVARMVCWARSKACTVM